jgi:hypothetical protein
LATITKKCSSPDQRRCRHGWVVRYRANGKQHEKTFLMTARLANDYTAQVEHEKRSADYVDPKAGDVTFQACAERWISQHRGAGNTKTTYRTALKHIIPAMGGTPLRQITREQVRELLRHVFASIAHDDPGKGHCAPKAAKALSAPLQRPAMGTCHAVTVHVSAWRPC